MVRTIVFLGDSITAGYGVLPQLAFPAQLESMLENVICINQGRTGWATTGYVRRLPDIVAGIPKNVDYCCIQLGANDLRLHGHSGTVVAQCVTNMMRILTTIQRDRPNTHLILMSSPKIDIVAMPRWLTQAGFGEQTNNYLARLHDEYKALAYRQKISFIELLYALPSGYTLDGAHPTIEGHRILAKYIKVELERIWG
ncbi:SGNH/GDSL hydrolase family protein [candidate division KSB1 bacterium]|nr:SGNH/GDSL hydrolase family protein [candidate division KSB1 bacterium]